MMMEPISPKTILDFWFGTLDEDGLAAAEFAGRWFASDSRFDQTLRERYLGLHRDLRRGEGEDWKTTAAGRLAWVIVLDQFSRNMFRDTPEMFAGDNQALEAAVQGIEQGQDRERPTAHRTFLYMPFMHSETLEDQNRCVELFTACRDSLDGRARQVVENNVAFAIRHREIIALFGRFPHRNAILGRTSTDEEHAFLQTPGSSF